MKDYHLLFEENYRLVYYFSNRYLFVSKKLGIDFDDIIQEGCIGLLEACKKFDPSKRVSLSTYSSFYIRKQILSLLSSRRIRDLNTVYYKSLREREKINNKKDLSKINERLRILKEYKIRSQSPISLDETFDSSKNSMIDLIEDHSSLSVEDQVFRKIQRENISKSLSRLDSFERELLLKRFGFNSYRIHTLKELGQETSLSIERVRKIILKTLDKIKSDLSKYDEVLS